jgi:hypothetical protein
LEKDESIYNELVAQGKIFVKYAIGRHYLQHAEGRFMVDFSKRKRLSGVREAKVKEEELFMCFTRFYGFNFVSKVWNFIEAELLDGIILNLLTLVFIFCFVSYVSLVLEISFEDDAFDKLVLDPTTKKLILSLVESNYSGEGSGCTFLLHGPPGGL